MQAKVSYSKVTLYQSIGFLVIIALSWFVEITGLRELVLGSHPYISDFKESTLEMVLVLGVWLLVAGSTRRLQAHVSHLEGFMRVCAWCHHICHNGKWMPLKEFVRMSFDTPTTHGICPKCLKEQMGEEEKRAVTPRGQTEQDRSSLPSEWRSRGSQVESPGASAAATG